MSEPKWEAVFWIEKKEIVVPFILGKFILIQKEG